jgi:hypothetical protein
MLKTSSIVAFVAIDKNPRAKGLVDCFAKISIS